MRFGGKGGPGSERGKKPGRPATSSGTRKARFGREDSAEEERSGSLTPPRGGGFGMTINPGKQESGEVNSPLQETEYSALADSRWRTMLCRYNGGCQRRGVSRAEASEAEFSAQCAQAG
jgi:hypothetical protein